MSLGRTSRVYRDAWAPWRDNALMERVSEGLSFSEAADAIGVSKDQAKNRFNRLAKRMGAQAV